MEAGNEKLERIERANNGKRSALTAHAPLLGLALLYLITIGLKTGVMEGSQLEAVTPDHAFAELKGRLTWGVSVVFFALSISATFVLAAEILGHACGNRPEKRRVRLMIAGTAFLAVICSFIYPSDFFSFNDAFFSSTVYATGNAESFVAAVELLGNLAIFILAIVVSAILAGLDRERDALIRSDVKTFARSLSRAQKRVRVLLYVGATSLIAGTLHASLLYSWSVSMIPVDSAPHGLYASSLPEVMGAVTGSFYSALLAAVFLPALVQLKIRADELLDTQNIPVEEQAGWLKENGLDRAVFKQAASMIAVVAPLIAGGPVTTLLELMVR